MAFWFNGKKNSAIGKTRQRHLTSDSRFAENSQLLTGALSVPSQGLTIMTTKMAAGEDLQGMLASTALGDATIDPSLPSLMNVGQAQGEGELNST